MTMNWCSAATAQAQPAPIPPGNVVHTVILGPPVPYPGFALIVVAWSGVGPAGSLAGGNPARGHPQPRPSASIGTQPQE